MRAVAIVFLILLPVSPIGEGAAKGLDPKSLMKDFGAIMVAEDVTFEVHQIDKAKYSVKRKIDILRSEERLWGILKLAESRFFKIKKFVGVLYNANYDTIVALEKKDGLKVCGFSEYALFSDYCQWIYELSSQEYPYTVEYYYETEYNSLFFWPEWQPQKSIPVRHSQYTLIVPEDMRFATSARGNIPAPRQGNQYGKVRITYGLNEVMPLDEEAYVYDADQARAGVRFAATEYTLAKYRFTGGSWESLGRDYFAMISDCLSLNDRQKKLMERLRNESSEKAWLCEHLQEEIRQGTRYVAIEIGIGAWKPTPSSETFERGYGDCKDLSIMYASLLGYVDIETHPALVMTRDMGSTDPSFPLLNFNHVIFYTVIDGDTSWTDPTCPYCDIGDLPWLDEDIFVLALDSTGGELVRTNGTTAEDNCRRRKAEVDIGTGRSVQVKHVLSGTGNVDQELRALVHYSDLREMENFLKESDFCLSKKVRYDSIHIETAPDPVIHVSGTMRNAVHVAGDNAYLTLEYFSPLRDREQVKLSGRVLPLDLRYPMTYVDTIIVNMPSDWEVDQLPEAVDLASEYGSLKTSFKLTGTQLVISRIRRSFNYYISSDKLAAFDEYLKSIKKNLPEYIAFSSR